MIYRYCYADEDRPCTAQCAAYCVKTYLKWQLQEHPTTGALSKIYTEVEELPYCQSMGRPLKWDMTATNRDVPKIYEQPGQESK